MKIGIVGLGIVGSAVRHGFEKLGHQVEIHDIKLDTKLVDILDSEIIYLCVPTPQSENGKCDTSIIEAIVGELVETHKYSGVIVLKSTIEPGTTQKLQDKFGTKMICHVPEFLRERVAIADFIENHDICIIGTESDEVFEKVKESHGHYPKHFIRLNPTEAEIAKYFNNVYNATLITFANAFYEVCQVLGADYGKIKSAMIQRDHISKKYLDCNENLRGFGGMCLPKDTSAIASLVEEHGLPIRLFDAIVEDNKEYKTTVFEGMRI
jgi:UDPglucose 6-dehydrogenase